MFMLDRRPRPSAAPSPARKPASSNAGAFASPRVALGLQSDFARFVVLPPPVQRKPTVSSPGDPYEREADEVEEKNTVQAKRAPSASAGATLDAEAAARAAQRGGEPLPKAVRDFFEPRFGHDFSRVRVHADNQAEDAARAVQARAYTVRHDIVFGSGQYAPDTAEGKRLLAHELAHTIQQGASAPRDGLQPNPLEPAAGTAVIQRDLMRLPPSPNAVAATLTPAQVAEAIRFNNRYTSDPSRIGLIRDMVGVSPSPEVVDEEFVQAIARWQAMFELTQDGKLTPSTITTIAEELRAEAGLVPSLMDDAERLDPGPIPVFDHSGGQTATINADTAPEFAQNINAQVGSPHTKTEFLPDIQFSTKTNSTGGEVPGSQKITSIALTVNTGIVKVRFGSGRPNEQHKKAIKEMVTAIEAHEEKHRTIIERAATVALRAAQKFVGTGKTKEAEKALTTALECTVNKKHEALDAVEGLLTAVEQQDGSVRVTKSGSGAKYPCSP